MNKFTDLNQFFMNLAALAVIGLASYLVASAVVVAWYPNVKASLLVVGIFIMQMLAHQYIGYKAGHSDAIKDMEKK